MIILDEAGFLASLARKILDGEAEKTKSTDSYEVDAGIDALIDTLITEKKYPENNKYLRNALRKYLSADKGKANIASNALFNVLRVHTSTRPLDMMTIGLLSKVLNSSRRNTTLAKMLTQINDKELLSAMLYASNAGYNIEEVATAAGKTLNKDISKLTKQDFLSALKNATINAAEEDDTDGWLVKQSNSIQQLTDKAEQSGWNVSFKSMVDKKIHSPFELGELLLDAMLSTPQGLRAYVSMAYVNNGWDEMRRQRTTEFKGSDKLDFELVSDLINVAPKMYFKQRKYNYQAPVSDEDEKSAADEAGTPKEEKADATGD